MKSSVETKLPGRSGSLSVHSATQRVPITVGLEFSKGKGKRVTGHLRCKAP